MEYLRAIGRKAIGDFARLLSNPGVTGLLVETEPLLLRLWRIRTTMTRADWEAFDAWLARADLYWRERQGLPFGLGYDTLRDFPDVMPSHRVLPCDPDWSCRTFDEFRRHDRGRTQGHSGPGVVFTVLYEPSIPVAAFDELASTASEVPWRTRFASRPIASANAGPRMHHSLVIGGISVGAHGRQVNGTLGGVLVIDGTSYAVTCGHIIDASSQAVQPSVPDGGSMVIGTCVCSTDGSLTEPNKHCCSVGAANTVDAALVEIDVTASTSVRSVGPVHATVPLRDIAEGEIVRVSARSGTHSLEIGALALLRSVQIRDTAYCFQDLMELRRPGTHWAQKGTIDYPTKSGDSGAWVLRPEASANRWLGMVTASDGPSSYAQFAETVEAWANAAVPVP
jgi:hypothetical protein